MTESPRGGPEIYIEVNEDLGLPASRQSVKLPIHDEIEKGMNPRPLDDPPIDGRK